MISENLKSIGRLYYRMYYDHTGWYYINRQGEQVNMKLFVGTITHDNYKLNQIVIGPVVISWVWK